MGYRLVINCPKDLPKSAYHKNLEDMLNERLQEILQEGHNLLSLDSLLNHNYSCVKNEITGIGTIVCNDNGDPVLVVPDVEIVKDDGCED